FRSIGCASVNAFAFADIAPSQMSQATSFSFMAQRLSQALGVALAAALLHFFAGGAHDIPHDAFTMTFFAVATISCLSTFVFLRLPRTAGDDLAGHSPKQG